ncbi:zinc/iron permease [Hymenobacter busanensis]|uniref:Zinc/iron permease n=1 Tax=Hymenobacter busanensis TaxID=2607656 RepID=A0A7L5A1E5_9BACT|nr:ZIP family metal transporter [Hymenobacter busanensis]KAA9333073.1 zinc/iron permease [Hymenobacter busanensis]QHJ08252.1 ZIP family metal transporter [Hymenobacter busanensis]
MIVALLLLFGTVLGAGWVTRFVPTLHTTWLRPLLAFSGAYLVTLTLTHLLPEALTLGTSPERVGYFVLAGFFGQLVLELFSEGVEHGHQHVHAEHAHAGVPWLLLGSLTLHAFLEGSILVQDPHGHTPDGFYATLTGVALHHIPAAFALMAVLVTRLGSFQRALPWLGLFAAAAPLGVLTSHYAHIDPAVQGGFYPALLGLVSGNFLHVSTTILFEVSPEHHVNVRKLVATVAGLSLALLANAL